MAPRWRTDDEGEAPRRASRPTLPAWLLSVIVHTLALIALGLAWRSAPLTLPVEEARKANIVLAERGADDRLDYFTDADERAGPKSSPPSERDASPLPEKSSPAEAPLLANITLPGLAELAVDSNSAEGLIRAPRLTVGRRPTILPGLDDEAILAEDAARRRPTGPSGPTARISLFGSESADGHTFVFVVDRSQSMGSDGLGALSAVANELERELAPMLPIHQFQIIAYHQKPVYFGAKGMVAANDENKQAASKFFRNLAAFGGTQHETALLAALRLRPDVIFFLTDGGDPYLSEGQMELIARRAAGHTSIHCIQFGLGASRESNDFMRRLAQRNGGGYSYVDMSRQRR